MCVLFEVVARASNYGVLARRSRTTRGRVAAADVDARSRAMATAMEMFNAMQAKLRDDSREYDTIAEGARARGRRYRAQIVVVVVARRARATRATGRVFARD